MQELEREKDSLQLQVTVLEDQIESQSRRLADMGKYIDHQQCFGSGSILGPVGRPPGSESRG